MKSIFLSFAEANKWAMEQVEKMNPVDRQQLMLKVSLGENDFVKLGTDYFEFPKGISITSIFYLILLEIMNNDDIKTKEIKYNAYIEGIE